MYYLLIYLHLVSLQTWNINVESYFGVTMPCTLLFDVQTSRHIKPVFDKITTRNRDASCVDRFHVKLLFIHQDPKSFPPLEKNKLSNLTKKSLWICTVSFERTLYVSKDTCSGEHDHWDSKKNKIMTWNLI